MPLTWTDSSAGVLFHQPTIQSTGVTNFPFGKTTIFLTINEDYGYSSHSSALSANIDVNTTNMPHISIDNTSVLERSEVEVIWSQRVAETLRSDVYCRLRLVSMNSSYSSIAANATSLLMGHFGSIYPTQPLQMNVCYSCDSYSPRPGSTS